MPGHNLMYRLKATSGTKSGVAIDISVDDVSVIIYRLSGAVEAYPVGDVSELNIKIV
ncbi:hypothetical protein [Lacticaseibacillus pantheris]|uniref:hypothetical protein n=1 Tax=Lacticaseibacillus pantheris TaxID=171523 RepID=UPI00265994BB|nr:hypothetical protein [Lacticaseibacillus pantheris]WKF86009.1 hypothetical protein QY874_05360 [Lacticaseibacillus pantheris]